MLFVFVCQKQMSRKKLIAGISLLVLTGIAIYLLRRHKKNAGQKRRSYATSNGAANKPSKTSFGGVQVAPPIRTDRSKLSGY